MPRNLVHHSARLHIQVPSELKNKLIHYAELEGKKVSLLVRESLEDKLREIERKQFEERMKQAYLDLAEENMEISEDFQHVDSENL